MVVMDWFSVVNIHVFIANYILKIIYYNSQRDWALCVEEAELNCMQGLSSNSIEVV